MTKRSNTEKNLSVVVDRNVGNRKSLVLDDDYDYSNGKISESETDLWADFQNIKAPTGLENNERNDIVLVLPTTNEKKHVELEPLMLKIDAIHRVNPTRLRHRKKKPVLQDDKMKENQEEGKYMSRFGDIKFYSILSTIFDSSYFKNSEFFGIYVLFWLGTAFLMMNSLVHSYFENSELLFNSPIVMILRKDIVKIGLTDLAMYLSTYFAYFLQYACMKDWILWDSSGWIIQSVYNFLHGAFWLYFSSDHFMGYPWIGKVFLLLHNFVFIMKMHSFAYYNGYLWQVLRELEFSENYLQKLQNGSSNLPSKYDLETTTKILDESIRFCKFELEYQSNATTMNPEFPLESYSESLRLEVLQQENIVKFPQNINLFDFFEFSMFPTLVYTLNYPRTRKIRWMYVLEKSCGVFGIIFLMILCAQNWMYPLVQRAIALQDAPPAEKYRQFVFILLDMIPPFLMVYLFTFFLIWDAILNVIAELSCFADRDFYGPWWSCTDWSEYARIWNRPVHKFLLRHVYHSSISALRLNKFNAVMVTFVLSSLVHELVMFVIFNRLRGYLLLMQMSQIPLVMITNTKLFRDKKILGNVICWFGLVSVPSAVCTLYLIF